MQLEHCWCELLRLFGGNSHSNASFTLGNVCGIVMRIAPAHTVLSRTIIHMCHKQF